MLELTTVQWYEQKLDECKRDITTAQTIQEMDKRSLAMLGRGFSRKIKRCDMPFQDQPANYRFIFHRGVATLKSMLKNKRELEDAHAKLETLEAEINVFLGPRRSTSGTSAVPPVLPEVSVTIDQDWGNFITDLNGGLTNSTNNPNEELYNSDQGSVTTLRNSSTATSTSASSGGVFSSARSEVTLIETSVRRQTIASNRFNRTARSSFDQPNNSKALPTTMKRSTSMVEPASRQFRTANHNTLDKEM
ncbi:hypothetical protein LTR50_006404 [Elasticomyces elasticus]|nr:hypothetical protein LTR50_006404 [Elasticomyces elasticus]